MRILVLPLLLLAATPSTPDADARFRAIAVDEYGWRLRIEARPEGEGAARLTPPHLPDVSPAAERERERRWTATIAALDAIPPASLSEAARVDYAVYRGQVEALLAAARFREYEKPANSDSGFWDVQGFAGDGPLRSAEDYRRYVARLGELPRYFDQQIANMRAGAARGFTPPRVTLAGRDVAIAAVADARRAQDTRFWTPFETFPVNVPAAEGAALRRDARAVIEAGVIPAYARLLAYWRDDYVPHATTALAAEAGPGGAAYYRSKIREFTTLDLTPDVIHAIGLAEMKDIRAEMEAAMRQAGFAGDLPAFQRMLRTDPRFYARTPDELLKDAAWIAKRFDGKASTWFGHLPRSRFAIRPVPAAIAPFYTAGRGDAATYLVNTADLPSRPLFQLTALTLHESAPGHAFQLGLAAENEGQPRWRRDEYVSAYGEGWALYCERLGDEMGMYETSYDRFGMLSYQAWRAARLVVDTGIHHLGWSRGRAIAYLRENTALSDREIGTEVDRYISWPGQALSYYLGELDIRRNRARAEAALGPRFSLRAFHDVVLELGSVPLAEIDRRIDRFIADGGRGPYPDDE